VEHVRNQDVVIVDGVEEVEDHILHILDDVLSLVVVPVNDVEEEVHMDDVEEEEVVVDLYYIPHDDKGGHQVDERGSSEGHRDCPFSVLMIHL